MTPGDPYSNSSEMKCVKTTPSNPFHKNSTIHKERFLTTLQYNSGRELLHIKENNIKRKLLANNGNTLGNKSGIVMALVHCRFPQCVLSVIEVSSR